VAENPGPVIAREGRARRKKIRLAYLSPRFSREIVGYFFKPLFDHHDREQFEIHLYCATPRTDDMTDYLSQRADGWTLVGDLSDTALCRRIAEDEIDILVDLAGHAPENRMTALARKPAPVQISMLDYFDTTGLPTMDYYVTDSFSTTPDSPQRFTEELIILDQPRLVYEAPDYAPPVAERPSQASGLVFGSFNRHHKIVPRVVETWSGLLRAVEDSRLVLKGGHFTAADVQENFLRQFEKHGVEGARIEFRGASSHQALLAEYGDIDIALDTFPYNGGLTTCEALWMGVPVITILGDRIISRQTAGMLEAVDLGEFVAADADEFAAIGKHWSEHREQLNGVRAGLRQRMAASPLTDGATYTADFEAHLRRIWAAHLAAQAED
jgi:predicted O-linked N-acetylglucosamine transferase (SPINDLY family)